LARVAGVSAIEWIYDLHGAEVNPIGTEGGISEIATLSAQSHVQVRSVCADYFMDRPLLRAQPSEIEERTRTLQWLLRQCARLGVLRLVLPFVDASRIDTEAERDVVVTALRQALPIADETGVELHLETSLSPSRFADLLARLPDPIVKVNYDSGNSASLGYDPVDEFAAYGARVGSVHIKDRVLGGGTVPLGTGNADLNALLMCLNKVGYQGDFVLQVARGADGDEVGWVKRNLDFVVALQAGVG
jgi:hexulose-6-phosphate isomerase